MQQYNNSYSYCGANPIALIDPDGMFDFSAIEDEGTKANLMKASEMGYAKLYEGEAGSRSIDQVYGILGANTPEAMSGVDAQLSTMFTNGQGPAITLGNVGGGFAMADGTSSLVIDPGNSFFSNMTSSSSGVRRYAFEGMARMFEHEPIHTLENMYGIPQPRVALVNSFQDRANMIQAGKYRGGMGHMAKLRDYMDQTSERGG